MSTSLPKIQKIAYLLFIILTGVWILKVGSFIFIPLVWGIFLSFSLYPLAKWFELRRIPRPIAIIFTLVMVSAIIGLVLYTLIYQVMGLILDIPEISTAFNNKISSYFKDVGELVGMDSDNLPEIESFITTEGINATLLGMSKSLVLAGIIPLFVFLMLYYTDFFMVFIRKISKGDNSAISIWIDDSGKIIQSYLVGMVIVTAIVSLISGIVFYFLGIKYFVLFAVMIAFMNLIPYIGVIISSFLVVFYVLLTTDSLVYPLVTLLSLWVIQLIENNLITPVIVGSKVNVNTLVVILAILAGGALWGISGMILFIPLVGVLKITFDRIPSLEPIGFLLGDKIPVVEKNENYWKAFLRNLKTKKEV